LFLESVSKRNICFHWQQIRIWLAGRKEAEVASGSNAVRSFRVKVGVAGFKVCVAAAGQILYFPHVLSILSGAEADKRRLFCFSLPNQRSGIEFAVQLKHDG